MADVAPVSIHAQSVRHTGKIQPMMLGKYAIRMAKSPISMAQIGQTVISHAGFRTMTDRTSRYRGSSRSESASTPEKAEEEAEIEGVKKIEETSDYFEKGENPELDQEELLSLMSKLAKGDTKEQLLAKIQEQYGDYYLADEALNYLIEKADQDLVPLLKEAKTDLNAAHGRFITAGRNIGTEPLSASKNLSKPPSALRTLYHDIISNPREATELFEELSSKFSFKELDALIHYLLHSIGRDLKSKGPSIERGELHNLFTECRSLQAIRLVYLFFSGSMSAITKEFERYGLTFPSSIKFENLAKQFVHFIAQKYPTLEKVFMLSMAFGLQKSLEGQAILYNWFRIATYETSPKLFKNLKHREEIRKLLREAIKKIDDLLEKEEDEEHESV